MLSSQGSQAGCILSSDPQEFDQQMEDRLLAMKLQKEIDLSLEKGPVKKASFQELDGLMPYDECVVCLERPATAGFVHDKRCTSLHQDSKQDGCAYCLQV